MGLTWMDRYFRDDPDAKGENLGDRRTPASRVHTDYTTEGGVARLKALLPDEAETLMRTPFAIYQVRCCAVAR